MNIRAATKADASTWWQLWSKFMEEHDKHSTDKLGPEAKEFWESHFFGYATGSLAGVVLLMFADSKPVGVMMAGEPIARSPVPSKLGLVAHLWGAWIEPSYRNKRLVGEFRDQLFNHCKLAGLDTLTTMVYTDNHSPIGALEAHGAVQYAVCYRRSL